MNISEYTEKLTSQLKTATLLNAAALEDLYRIRETNPFLNENFTIHQLESAQIKCNTLRCTLEALYKEIFNSHPTYRPLDLIITSSSKAAQVGESLELILKKLLPLRNFECEFISIYEASLIDLQLSHNNLIIAAKLSLI